MLNVAVAEIALQRSGVVALVRQREAAGMPQHVRVRLEAKTGDFAEPFDHAGKASRRERRTTLRHEYERALGLLLTVQAPQGAQFIASDRMRRRCAFFGPTHGKGGLIEIDLRPLQVYQLGSPEAVAVRDQDHGRIPVAPSVGLGGLLLPVIYATGYSPVQPRPLPGSLFLQKPYHPDQIVQAVRQMTEGRLQ